MKQMMATVFVVAGLVSGSAFAQGKLPTKAKAAGRSGNEQHACEQSRGTWRGGACVCGEYGQGFVSCPDSRGGFCPDWTPPDGNTVRIVLVAPRARGGCEAAGAPLECAGIRRTNDTLATGMACLEKKRQEAEDRLIAAVRDQDVDPAHLPNRGEGAFTRQECALLRVPAGDHYDECVWGPGGVCSCENFGPARTALEARPRYLRQCMGEGIPERDRPLCDRCFRSHGAWRADHTACDCSPMVLDCAADAGQWSCEVTLGETNPQDRFTCQTERTAVTTLRRAAETVARQMVAERTARIRFDREVADLRSRIASGLTRENCADVKLVDGSQPPREVCEAVEGWYARDGRCGFCNRVPAEAVTEAESEEEEAETEGPAPPQAAAHEPAAPSSPLATGDEVAETAPPAAEPAPIVTGRFESPDGEEGEAAVTVEEPPVTPPPAGSEEAPAPSLASPPSPPAVEPFPIVEEETGHEERAPRQDALTGQEYNPYEHFSCENVVNCTPPWPVMVTVLGGVAAFDLPGLQVGAPIVGLGLRLHTDSRFGLGAEATYGYAGTHRGRAFHSLSGAALAVVRLDRRGDHAVLAGLGLGALGLRGDLDTEDSFAALRLGYSVSVLGGSNAELRIEPRLDIFYRLEGDPNGKGSRALAPHLMVALAL